MRNAVPDLAYTLDAIEPLVAEAAGASRPETRQLLQALGEFLRIARSPESAALQPGEITELGDYALQILHRLMPPAPGAAANWEPAVLAVAGWIMERDGRLQTLEPVVDALAARANRLREPEALGRLADFMERIAAACAQSVRADLEAANPGRPWRLLHLNRAITATRSLDPQRMERAFDALVASLPHDAPEFFHEGMREMDRLNYPQPVRELVARYHARWTRPKTN
jgi:hypothetical protein